MVRDGVYAFACPGCRCGHVIPVAGKQPTWGWNGSIDAPTFMPSICVHGKSLVENKWTDFTCHSFVNDGKIQFLSDSTHAFAGKTVDLPDWGLDEAYFAIPVERAN
jgi:hypothetical protein